MSTDIVCTDKQLEDYKRINKKYEDDVEKADKNNKYAEQIGDLTEDWMNDLQSHGLSQEIQDACFMRAMPPPVPPSADEALPYKRMGGRRHRHTIRRRKSTKRKHGKTIKSKKIKGSKGRSLGVKKGRKGQRK